MTDSSFDVLVIGAGPAGSAAAYHARQAGLRVHIVDAKPFPRAKTCGDALTPRALAAIARMDLHDLPGHRVRGVLVRHESATRYEDFATHQWPRHGLVVSRMILDAALLRQARAVGASFEVGYAQQLCIDRDRVVGARIDTEHGARHIRARHVVVATGSGLARRLLGPTAASSPAVWGIAGRTYVSVNGDAGDDLETFLPLLSDGRLLSGYGWVFPNGPCSVTIGVGVFRTRAATALSLRTLVEHFIRERAAVDRRFANVALSAPIESSAIAVGPVIAPRPGFLPAGDLAGLANPFTGEGIAAALESGELAARAIVVAPDDATESYRAALSDRLPRHYRLRPALSAMHQRPALLLRRGADLVTSDEGTVACSLQQLMWDHEPLPYDRGYAPEIDRIVAAARADIIAASYRMRPLFGQLVSYLMMLPSVGFGWYAAFAGAVRTGIGRGSEPLDHDTSSLLAALELINLVSALHRDLPVRERSRGGRVWGRQTLSLMVADTLTADALKRLYRLEPAAASHVAAAARGALRHQAATRSNAAVSAPQDARAETELFLLAAHIGAGLPFAEALPNFAHTIAARLGAMRRDGEGVKASDLTALQEILSQAPDTLGQALAGVLSVIMQTPVAVGTRADTASAMTAESSFIHRDMRR